MKKIIYILITLIFLAAIAFVFVYVKAMSVKDSDFLQELEQENEDDMEAYQLKVQTQNALKDINKSKPKEKIQVKSKDDDYNLAFKKDAKYEKAIIDIKYFKDGLEFSPKSKLLEKKKQKIIAHEELKTRPKLIIIIDDIALSWQEKITKDTKLKLNLAFLPPTKEHPNSAKLANKTSFFIVHLPLEALDYKAPEPNTLKVGVSEAQIEKRIEKIQKLFPKMRFLNNHTGSAFTSDEKSMRAFLKVLKKHDLFFIDSKTTPDSKTKKISKELNLIYLNRDVFLDNKANLSYIKGQIKELLKIADKRGYAVAIGHPKEKTMQALKESKELFKKYELWYVDELYDFLLNKRAK